MQPRRLLPIFVVLAVGTSGAAAAPTPSFHLVFDGRHTADLLHQGPFTTSVSWCPSGSAVDVGVDATTDTAERRFTCTGGDSFTAKVRPLPAEHGGSGAWQIVSGTGSLADLRGKGTFTSSRVSGSSDDPATITFRSTWDGTADFDASPPAIRIAHAGVRKVKHRRLAYRVRVALVLRDNRSDVVSYTVQISAAKRILAFRLGEATSPTATVSARVTVRKTTRAVRIDVAASDAVGNESSLVKTARLR